MNAYYLTGSCVAGFALMMVCSRELLERIEAHLHFKRTQSYQQREDEIISLRKQLGLMKASRDEWRANAEAEHNEAVSRSSELARDLERLSDIIPSAQSVTDSIDVERPVDDISMFHIRQAG